MKYKISLLILLVACIACENQDFEYQDFEYTAVYFPVQYPVKTLVLGDDRIDNSMDRELKFQIGVAIGGLYSNNRSWQVEYAIEKDLVDTLVNQKGDTLKVLPDAYYTLNPPDKITIDPGSFSGFAEVQLTNNFLDDPLAIVSSYVIPLRIKKTDADSILTGKPLVLNPDPHIPDNWDPNAQPKDFVLFGIKYINPYHGYYLHRGLDINLGTTGDPVDTVIYSQKYREQDQVVEFITTGRSSIVTNFVGINTSLDGKYSMELLFSDDGTVKIDSTVSSLQKTTGTGRFVDDGDEWAGIKQNAIYLDYSYKVGEETHHVLDTLVYRNNGVAFEENTVVQN